MVDHSTKLQGVGGAPDAPPLILERTDQEFIPAILDELARERGLSTIPGSAARARDKRGVLTLFQPVHRTFNVALVEAACDTIGRPRLDPERIESAGLVIRRIASGPRGEKRLQGWRQKDRAVRGWVPFKNRKDEDLDPDPVRRRPELTAGHVEIDRRLATFVDSSESYEESVAPMFVAPPDVCKAAGRTILYGVVPVTSSDMSEEARSAPSYEDEETGTALKNHLSRFLQSGGSRSLPRAGQNLDSDDGKPPALASNTAMQEFTVFLRQLAIEFDAFGDGPQSHAFFAELNTIRLSLPGSVTRPAGDFLKQATEVLVELDPAQTFTMPLEWPAISQAQGNRIFALIKQAIKGRLAVVAPREGRFEDSARQYQLRAFVRVKHEDGCPPELVWSRESEPFAIVPWYASGALPPVRVALPDALDREFLKKVKPNVAFSVPKSLFNVLNGNDPKKMVDGEGGDGKPGFDLDWICSFSIPIITICAFIVLNIFLSLFDIIFRWMLFIKICIPIPRSK
jgi:hypothetical protein